MNRSRISLAEGVAKVTAENGPVIEAKFELGDDGNLSLSVYPAAKGLAMDAERNVFQELAGDPTATPFHGNVETFADQEHLTRSARDLTLVQLSKIGVGEAVARSADMGKVFWASRRSARIARATESTRSRSAGSSAIASSTAASAVHRTPRTSTRATPSARAPAPARPTRAPPKLGDDLTVVRTSKVSMAAALAAMEAANGPAIEAKFEIGDDGTLSLSIYPVGQGIATDSERNSFLELAGDPTATTYPPEKTEFKVPDVEHLTRSSRDLTLVQTANVTLRNAVAAVDRAMPAGFVYWAIPTVREALGLRHLHARKGQPPALLLRELTGRRGQRLRRNPLRLRFRSVWFRRRGAAASAPHRCRDPLHSVTLDGLHE